MTPVDLILTDTVISVLGLALLHFVWQGGLVALGLWLVLRIVPSSSARARYAAGCGALLLMAALPPATIAVHRASRADPHPGGTAALPAPPSTPAAATSARFGDAAVPAERLDTRVAAQDGADVASHTQRILPWVVTGWMAGVILLIARLGGAWVYTRRLRRLAPPETATVWQPAVERLTRIMALRRPVRVLDSAAVLVPTVVGWLKPAILLPPAALSGLPPAQVEALIAHELAHIRRHDHIVNVIQSVVETLLFYHPGVWWVSGRIRVEREFCCDDEAVRACGDPVEYARGLAALEEQRSQVFVLAASDGSLLDRIGRLLGEPAAHLRGAGLVPAVLLTAIVVTAAGVLLFAGEPGTEPTAIHAGPELAAPWPAALADPVELPDAPPEPQAAEPVTPAREPGGPAVEDHALEQIRAARRHLEQERARVTGLVAELPDDERARTLRALIRQLDRHRAALDRAEAEVIASAAHSGRRALMNRRVADGRQREEARDRALLDEERVRQLERLAERLADEMARKIEHQKLSEETIRRLEREAGRVAEEVARRLGDSASARQALRQIEENAARIAREATRAAVEVSRLNAEILNEVVAEAQRLSADVMRGMQSDEWRARLREIERAADEAARSLERQRRGR